MASVLYRAVPYSKDDVTRALETGVDGIVVPAEAVPAVSTLARCEVLADEELVVIALNNREDEDRAAQHLQQGTRVMLERGWEIIPVENLLARKPAASPLALEVTTAAEALLAGGILERGVETVVVPQHALGALPAIVDAARSGQGDVPLSEAFVTEILPVGLGHRVCVDTLSLLRTGQGMLVGNSAAFTFLVNAETEHNEFVAPRPFRINAGSVHAYALMPGDRTSYLEELRTGSEVLIVDEQGRTSVAVAGRLKVERRPMLLIRARTAEGEEGAVFLQNAETIRLVRPGGEAVSVVTLEPGDRILCRLDRAGRHFGMRIVEDIAEK